jgi:predicted metal-dependent hydrolase
VERLTFNTELLCESADVRKSVIVHELLHLKVPNHGKVLRVLLRAYLSADDATGIANHAWQWMRHTALHIHSIELIPFR